VRPIIRLFWTWTARQRFRWSLLYWLTSADWQGRQSCLEGLIDPLSIGRGQVVLGAQIPLRPDCGLIAGGKVGEFG